MHGWCGRKKIHVSIFWSIESPFSILCHDGRGENDTIHDQSLKKPSYKTLLNVSIKQRLLQILRHLPLLLRGLTVSAWNRHAFPRTKMVTFQSYNKSRDWKCSHVNWDTSASQIHCRSNHFTLTERKNENFQSTETISMHAYFLLIVLGT